MKQRAALLVLSVGGLLILLSMGTRQSLGLFLAPVSSDLGVGRETFSLAVALQNLVFGLPLLGILADRIGARWVAVFGALLFAGGFALLSRVTTPAGLYLVLGLIIGLALSALSYVVVLGAVAQVVPPERRSTAFGVITAAGSFGMFAVVPVAQWLLVRFGWQTAFLLLAAAMAGLALLALGLPGRTHQRTTAGLEPLGLPELLHKARGHGGYWLLNAGFFVCGFHVAFIATHLPAYLGDRGLTPAAAAAALSLIGLFNIVGSSLFGWLGDRYRKKFLLSLLYAGRALVIALFLLLPTSGLGAAVFGAAIGFLWLATVPLTSGMVAQIFGSRYLSTLYGIVFFSHQLGAFLGVWLGGRAFDATGSYTSVWLLAIALGVIAAALHLPIDDRTVLKERSDVGGQPAQSAP